MALSRAPKFGRIPAGISWHGQLSRGAFFIYIATVALLLRKPDGLFGRAERV